MAQESPASQPAHSFNHHACVLDQGLNLLSPSAGMRTTAVAHHAVLLSHFGVDQPRSRPRSEKASITGSAHSDDKRGRRGCRQDYLNIAWSTDDIVRRHNRKLSFFRPERVMLSPRLVPPAGGTKRRKEVKREDPMLQEQQYQLSLSREEEQQQQQEQEKRISSAALQQMHAGAGEEYAGQVSTIGISPVVQSELKAAIQLGSLRESSRLHIEAEICTAERPSMTLRGSSRKYTDKFAELSAAIRGVTQEPSAQEEGPFLHGAFSVLRFCAVKQTASPTKVAGAAASARLGAFEVLLVWENSTGEKEQVEIFSKLTCGLFPNVGLLLSDLVEILPRIANANSLSKISEEFRCASEASRRELKESMQTVQLLQTKLHEREALLLSKLEQASSAKQEASSASATISEVNKRLHNSEAELHTLRSAHKATTDDLLRSEATVQRLEADLREMRKHHRTLHGGQHHTSDLDAQLSNTVAELNAVKSAYETLRQESTSQGDLKRRLESAEQEASGYLGGLMSRTDELDRLRMQNTTVTEESKRLLFDLEVVKRALTTAQQRVILLEAGIKTEQLKNVEHQKRETQLNAAVTMERETVVQLKVKLQQTEQKVSLASKALESLHGRMQEAEADEASARARQQEESDRIEKENLRLKENVDALEEELRHSRAGEEELSVPVAATEGVDDVARDIAPDQRFFDSMREVEGLRELLEKERRESQQAREDAMRNWSGERETLLQQVAALKQELQMASIHTGGTREIVNEAGVKAAAAERVVALEADIEKERTTVLCKTAELEGALYRANKLKEDLCLSRQRQCELEEKVASLCEQREDKQPALDKLLLRPAPDAVNERKEPELATVEQDCSTATAMENPSSADGNLGIPEQDALFDRLREYEKRLSQAVHSCHALENDTQHHLESTMAGERDAASPSSASSYPSSQSVDAGGRAKFPREDPAGAIRLRQYGRAHESPLHTPAEFAQPRALVLPSIWETDVAAQPLTAVSRLSAGLFPDVIRFCCACGSMLAAGNEFSFFCSPCEGGRRRRAGGNDPT